ncbi:MAG: helix-turn-helix domain-containing protein [Wenzhouxiangella sp.]|nr:helix-turn-helix domain-containing protein [Wenzhouxiangella sp.]
MSLKLRSSDRCLRQFVEQVAEQYLEDMGNTPPDNLHQVIMAEVEEALIRTVMDHTGGNQSRAAAILGITRATLRNRIQRYGAD